MEPLTVAIIVIASLFFLLICLYLGTLVYRFSLRMQYINMEIGRTQGHEKEYWERQKKKLINSVFPIYRKRGK